MKHDSVYLKKYRERMTEIMIKSNPNWKKKDIEKVIDKMIEKNFENPRVTLDNNYTGERRDTSLLSVVDWVMERKPIIAGNATFYKNQYEALNPIAQMLDNMADNRKKYKKQMFQAGEEFGQDSPEYKDFDRSQWLAS